MTTTYSRPLLTTGQRIGLVLFLIGFALFVGSLSLSEYKLTDEVLTQTIKKEQLADMRSATASMQGKVYSSAFGFVKDFKESVAKLNESLTQQDKKIGSSTRSMPFR